LKVGAQAPDFQRQAAAATGLQQGDNSPLDGVGTCVMMAGMTKSLLELSDRVIDLDVGEVRQGEQCVSLSSNEVSLLRHLLQAGGQPVTRARLLVDALGYAPEVVSRAADYAIHRLRRKIEQAPAEPRHLLTVPGLGFRLVREASQAPPPPEAPPAADHNLPVLATRFIGRAAELEQIDTLLSEGARLVTLIGPGGAGKTRLAARAGAAWCEVRQQRVRFCDLSAAQDGPDMLAGVARALGGKLAGADPVSALGAALAGLDEALLILDNLEQIAAPAAVILSRWLQDAPGLRVLVTSRHRLRLHHEHLLEVGPLDSEGDGSQLFTERAQRVRPELAVHTDADRQTIAALVAALDGLPLAIELAAARSAVLSPRQLLERLSRPDTLGSGPRDGVARHQTMQRAIAWSWSLLSEAEQAALAQLSVFRGGFDVGAIEAVVRCSTDAPAHTELLQALREKSMVIEQPGADPGRFRLLMTIREFAAARLSSPSTVSLRHARWVVARTRPGLQRHLIEREQDGLAMIAAESANLLHAIRQLSALGEQPALLAEARAEALRAWSPMDWEGYRDQLTDSLAHRAQLPPPVRWRVALAWVHHSLQRPASDRSEALSLCQEVADDAQRVGAALEESCALTLRAGLLLEERRFAEFPAVRQRLDRALEGHPVHAQHIQMAILEATASTRQGHHADAERRWRRCLSLAEESGRDFFAPMIYGNLAVLYCRQRRAVDQAQAARDGVLKARALRMRPSECRSLVFLAAADLQRGLLDEAERHCRDILTLTGGSARLSSSLDALLLLCSLDFVRGNLDLAAGHLRVASEHPPRAPWHGPMLAMWRALIAWAQWGVAEDVAALPSPRESDVPTPWLRPFLDGKRLAAQAFCATDDREAITAALEQLPATPTTPIDRLFPLLTGGDASPDLSPIHAQLQAPGAFDVAVSGFEAVCSRILLASVLAELELEHVTAHRALA